MAEDFIPTQVALTASNPISGSAGQLVFNTSLARLQLWNTSTNAWGSAAPDAVTSITLNTDNVLYSTPVIFSVSGGAASGTLSFKTQTKNTFLCGPSSGSAAAPTFRALTVSDLPAGTRYFAGTWNANTNTPTLASGTGADGATYIVSVAGSTTLDGISQWNVGDEAIFSASTGTWQKLDGIASEVLSVAGRTGAVTLTSSDVGLGNVTNDAQTKAAIVPNTAPAVGALLVGNAGATAYASVALSGDGTLSSSGAITVLKTNGTAFGTAATQNTGTSGGNIPLLNTAVTWSGAAAASAPSITLTTAPFTGGTGTTTQPLVYLNSGASAPSSWNTSGTVLGINAPSGWAGDFLAVHTNGGGTLFKVSQNGSVTGASGIFSGGISVSGAGSTFSAAITATGGAMSFNASSNNAVNINTGTSTGTASICGTSAKLSFFAATAVAQQSTTGTSAGFTAGSGTTATSTSTFTGGAGTSAYTVGDVVLALKNYGLLAA